MARRHLDVIVELDYLKRGVAVGGASRGGRLTFLVLSSSTLGRKLSFRSRYLFFSSRSALAASSSFPGLQCGVGWGGDKIDETVSGWVAGVANGLFSIVTPQENRSKILFGLSRRQFQ